MCVSQEMQNISTEEDLSLHKTDKLKTNA